MFGSLGAHLEQRGLEWRLLRRAVHVLLEVPVKPLEDEVKASFGVRHVLEAAEAMDSNA